METITSYLKSQNINEELIEGLLQFRAEYNDSAAEETPQILYYGSEILEEAVAALLQGENILLSGAKATGKNVLCETLSYLFGRPSYEVSFHVNTDSEALIGTDTFKNNEVQFRSGPVYDCAKNGGFCVLDEVNMAKNDAVSVLHATLDHRRRINIPGYEKVNLHPATRFIGTMNYGYAGTKELNEALVSRFMVIDMPPLEADTIRYLLKKQIPQLKESAAEQFSGLFIDLQEKAYHDEISSKSLDLRGLIGSIKTMQKGLSPLRAIRIGIINKCFDAFEKELIEDTVSTRISAEWTKANIFEG